VDTPPPPARLPERLRQRLQAWRWRRRPRADRLTLTHRNLYILPTASGWLFALLLLALLLASINYQLNLGHLLTFALASAGLVAMHATHAALRGLRLEIGAAEPVFAGEGLELLIRIDDLQPAARPWRFGRHGILLRWRDQPEDSALSTSVPDGQSVTVRLTRPTTQRGPQALPPLEVACRFPLGLFRAWSVWRIAREPLVWPAPEAEPPPLPDPQDDSASGAAARRISTPEDGEHGMRPWLRGDRPSQVLWKQSTRSLAGGGPLLVREPPRPPDTGRDVLIDASGLPGLDEESRLRRLCAWVIAAERDQHRWTLVAPALRIGPGQGAAQRRAALDALALWPGRPR